VKGSMLVYLNGARYQFVALGANVGVKICQWFRVEFAMRERIGYELAKLCQTNPKRARTRRYIVLCALPNIASPKYMLRVDFQISLWSLEIRG